MFSKKENRKKERCVCWLMHSPSVPTAPPSLLDVLDSGCSPDVCHTQLLRLCPHHSWFLLMYIKWAGRASLGQLTKERLYWHLRTWGLFSS